MKRPRALALLCLLALTGLSTTPAAGQTPDVSILTHRQQASLIKGFIEKRFETLLPRLMREAGIDMWIIVSREYNDDPVFRSMAPMTTYSSRRRTILVFFLEAGGPQETSNAVLSPPGPRRSWATSINISMTV